MASVLFSNIEDGMCSLIIDGEEFIEEGTKWIHLDIAGTSDKDEVATGVMIETIVHFFENECK